MAGVAVVGVAGVVVGEVVVVVIVGGGEVGAASAVSCCRLEGRDGVSKRH